VQATALEPATTYFVSPPPLDEDLGFEERVEEPIRLAGIGVGFVSGPVGPQNSIRI